MVIYEILLIILFFTVVISFSPVGNAFADVFIRKKAGNLKIMELEKKYLELEALYKEHDEELTKLREFIVFNDKRIADSISDETEKNIIIKQQQNNLEKNI